MSNSHKLLTIVAFELEKMKSTERLKTSVWSNYQNFTTNGTKAERELKGKI